MRDMNEKRPWKPSEADFNPGKNPMWEILRLLKSIDKNVKEINEKLK
jgi:hypothetical protein